MWPVPLLATATALSAVPLGVLLWLVWRDRDQPGARPYALMLVAMMGYDVVYALLLVVADPGLHESLFPVVTWLKLLVAIPWLLFALEYTGRGRFATRRLTLGLLAVPLAVLAVAVTPFRDGLILADFAVQQRAGVYTGHLDPGPLWSLLIVYGMAVLGVGLLLLLEFAIADRRRYGLQTSILAFGGLVPGITSVVHAQGLAPLPNFDVTPLAFTVGAAVVAFGLVRWDLFGYAPATQRAGQVTAIDDFGDAVLIVDEDDRLVDCNSRAADLLGKTGHDLAQEPVSAVVGTEVDVAAPPETVRLETTVGRRDFDVAVSTIEGPRGGRLGYTLVLHDVTDEKQRRQSSEVLNRILRHNVRNAMNAVEGYTRELGEHTDEEGEWMLERIENQTTELIELSEKVRDIDRVTDTAQSRSQFSVCEALEGVAAQLEAESPELTVTTHVPGTLAVTANHVIFENVIRYAIASLLGQNGTEDPRIVMTATPTDAERPRIEVTITSNGDPIPTDERAVIQRGEETPLAHSDDLDLWLVAWGVETLGGELSFVDDPKRPGLSMQIPDFWETVEGAPGDLERPEKV